MRESPFPWARTAIVAVCAITVSTGCFLDRTPRPIWSSVSLNEYCPNDTITAGFDFLGDLNCPFTDGRCESSMPNVTISHMPEAGASEIFPPQSIRSFRSSFAFTAPDVEQITVAFQSDRNPVRIPHLRDNEPGNTDRVIDPRRSDTMQRIDETRYREYHHSEMCTAGALPTYAPAVIRDESMRISPNARLTEVCNDDVVAFKIALTGGVPGEMFERNLDPGECIRLDAPGIPSSTQLATALGIKPISFPEGVCMDIKDRPTYIKTKAKFGCG